MRMRRCSRPFHLLDFPFQNFEFYQPYNIFQQCYSRIRDFRFEPAFQPSRTSHSLCFDSFSEWKNWFLENFLQIVFRTWLSQDCLTTLFCSSCKDSHVPLEKLLRRHFSCKTLLCLDLHYIFNWKYFTLLILVLLRFREHWSTYVWLPNEFPICVFLLT